MIAQIPRISAPAMAVLVLAGACRLRFPSRAKVRTHARTAGHGYDTGGADAHHPAKPSPAIEQSYQDAVTDAFHCSKPNPAIECGYQHAVTIAHGAGNRSIAGTLRPALQL